MDKSVYVPTLCGQLKTDENDLLMCIHHILAARKSEKRWFFCKLGIVFNADFLFNSNFSVTAHRPCRLWSLFPLFDPANAETTFVQSTRA